MDKNIDAPKASRHKKSTQTKKQITDAAMKLFSEKGYYNTNSKEIAKEAGVSIGCFYNYFDDKKEVFIDALDYYYLEFNTLIENKINEILMKPLDKKSMLFEIINTVLEAHSIFTGFHNELIVMYYSDSILFEKRQKQHKQSLEFTISALKQWVNTDKLNNLEISGTIIYSAIDSIVDRIVLLNEYDKKDEYIRELVEMISAYLL